MPSSHDELSRLRAALESLAAREVPGLLAEARADAHARAREALAELLAQSMLEQARHQLERPNPEARTAADAPTPEAPRTSAAADGPPTHDAPDAPDAPDAELGYYVYGVTAASDAALDIAPGGIDPEYPVSAVATGELAAVVSRVPLADFDEQRLREHLGDMVWVERVARRHEEVLEAAGAERTVIPMRLCTIYRDLGGVSEMLTRETAAMQDALGLLRGRSEWGVKMFAVADRRQPQPDLPDDAPDSGAAYLERQGQLRRRRSETDQQLASACETIHGQLARIAARALVLAPQRPEVSGHQGEMLLNGVYLVDDAELPRFHEAVGSLGREFAAAGLELAATGPWPAYNFVPDAIGVPA